MKVPNIDVALCSLLGLASSCLAGSIPPPTGRYAVGVRREVIEHYNDHDFLAPNNVSTSFLATIFYPTKRKASTNGPYLDPRTADAWEKIYGFKEGSLSTLTSNLVTDAPFLKAKDCQNIHPTILFGPGAGGPATMANTILLSELASHGYNVIGLDHPYEHEWLQYPNGTYIHGLPLDYDWGLPDVTEIYALNSLRLVDNAVLLKQLPSLAKKLGVHLNLTHVGTVGHSLGGSVAIGSLYEHESVKAGIDLDGSLLQRPSIDGPEADTHKPSLLLGFEEHFDESYRTYPDWQSAYFRGVRINGTHHNDFTDAAFWLTVGDNPDRPVGGSGLPQVKRVREIVLGFFDFTLLGAEEPELLNPEKGPEKDPALVFFDGTGEN